MQINKKIWKMSFECPAAAWHALRRSAELPTEAARFRMEQGREVGDLARRLFPWGRVPEARDGESRPEASSRLIEEPGCTAIFEATFAMPPLVARADIIERFRGGWHVLEVKSSKESTDHLPALIEDLTYTVMVARASGLCVERASLVLLRRAYRRGDPVAELFSVVDQTAVVNEQTPSRLEYAMLMGKQLLSESRPEPRLVKACRDCPFFRDDCLGHAVDHSVLELPRLHSTKRARLSEAGAVAMSDIPEDMTLTQLQTRVRDCAESGQLFVGQELGEALGAIAWPVHYLDFETVATALPLYDGYGCHEQLLTQFSLHRCDRLGEIASHQEFLAEPSRDCQRDLAERLIDAVGGDGSVLVYSNFEKTRMEFLATQFPDLGESLEAVISRLVDLYPLISKHVYHPDFRGSFSIKSVLPALVPELSHGDLDVQDGDTATMRFARMARGEVPDEELEDARGALLAYCARDTLAMVRLHEKLVAIAGAPGVSNLAEPEGTY